MEVNNAIDTNPREDAMNDAEQREHRILFIRLKRALMVLSDVTSYLDLMDQRGFITYGKPGGAERNDVQRAVANARKVLEHERAKKKNLTEANHD